MAIVSLTDKVLKDIQLNGLELASQLPVYFWDSNQRGLGIRLNRDGSLTWVMKLKVSGRTFTQNIGPWPSVKQKDARDQIATYRTRIRTGQHPGSVRMTPMLWSAVLDRFEIEHFPSLKPKSQVSYRSVLKVHLRGAFKNQMAHEIDTDDVRRFHQERAHISRQANVCLMVLRLIFERCEAWKCRPLNSNPVDLLRKMGFKAYKEGVRDRPLLDDELERLGAALITIEREGHVQFAAFVRVLLFSGARRGEVLTLEWEKIDQDLKIIRWDDSKTGRTSKPLNDALFAVIAALPRREGIPWVFPSDSSASGHMEDVRRAWQRMLVIAGITGLHRHDLRHNLGNVAADEGLNMQTVAALLGHRQVSTTDRYSKPGMDPRLDASNRVSTRLKEKLSGHLSEEAESHLSVLIDG